MRRPLAAVLALIGLLVAVPAAAQSPTPALDRTRYVLHATLDDAGLLVGSAEIHVVNTAHVPLEQLVFHLYANAFEGPRSVFAREGGLTLRGVAPTRNGGIDVLQLKTAGEHDLLASAERELVPGDHTQLRVALPEPLAPGASLVLHAAFSLRLPSLVARMGRAGDFHMFGQWFPKLAKLLPDGRFRSTPYHGVAEFDADFADYDLEVQVPARFVVAAPGASRSPRRGAAPGKRAERYVLERARDVAWAAAPALIRARDSSTKTAIEVFAPRGYSALAARQAARAAGWLAQLSQWLSPYPYERLVIVIPPRAAHGAAGMEYPGFVTGWSASLRAALPGFDLEHDFVTTHELAHQWFPMLVSNDEVTHPVLDEGLAQWLGLTLIGQTHGRAFFDRWLGVPADAFDTSLAMLASRSPDAAFPFVDVRSSLEPAPRLSARELGPAMYGRPAVVLEAIAARYGRARVLSALRRYVQTHRFDHVTLDDLGAAFDAELGAGFAAQTLMPALRGEPSALQAHARGRPHGSSRNGADRELAPSIFSRALALAQYALGWLAP
jgi:hypothetical protein